MNAWEFQQNAVVIIIHQAYAFLTNEETKKSYDSGKFDVLFSKKTVASQWEQHMKIISPKKVADASQSYKGSAAEENDIVSEFIRSFYAVGGWVTYNG